MSPIDLEQLEYEKRVRRVTCKLCKKKGRGTQAQLESENWSLTRRGTFCPRERISFGAAFQIADEQFEIGRMVGRMQMLNDQ